MRIVIKCHQKIKILPVLSRREKKFARSIVITYDKFRFTLKLEN